MRTCVSSLIDKVLGLTWVGFNLHISGPRYTDLAKTRWSLGKGQDCAFTLLPNYFNAKVNN